MAEAYRTILSIGDQPGALVLTRQGLPTLDRTKYGAADGVARGGYVLLDPPQGNPQVILIGTGSEVAICLAAAEKLAAEGVAARVVSMPCWELFDEQDAEYRDSVLPPARHRSCGRRGRDPHGLGPLPGSNGRFVGMDSFGASGPFEQLYEHFGITPDHVAAEAKAAIG